MSEGGTPTSTVTSPEAAGPGGEGSASLSFRIALPNFEGPLDLLLHLIREHKVDILDIPVALITEKYLEQLERMREINLDVAGEFLVMAATLAHLKSRMLLPRTEQPTSADPTDLPYEEKGDPRAELVRRLLDYQKYRDAAEQLGRADILDRDVFPRRVAMEEVPIPEEEVGLMEISVYKLIEALDSVLTERTPERKHEVVRERVSLSEAIRRVALRVRDEGSVSFFKLFDAAQPRHEIVITFLAMLEMCKLKLLRIRQEIEDLPDGSIVRGEDIVITANGDALERMDLREIKSDYRE